MPQLSALTTRIHLGGGVQESDLPAVEGALGHLYSRLADFPTAAIDMWLHTKDRDQPGMRTTLEVQLPDGPMFRARSTRELLGEALHEIGDKLVRQINDDAGKRAAHDRTTIRR